MKKLWIVITVLLIGSAGAGAWIYYQNNTDESEQETVNQSRPEPELSLPEKFVQAWVEADLPGTEPITKPPEITGHEEADAHIRQLAEERGYRLQSLPTVELTDIQGVSVQHEVAQAWQQLQDAARSEGIYLGLVSGFRSVENQRVIFQTQLQDRGIAEQERAYTSSQMAAGEADAVIIAILSEYSLPGYSKHHTGYVVDITDTGSDIPFDQFEKTEGHKWVSADNYANMRRFGFLPSYPEGGPPQGPDPEPWEYAWVGPATAEGL